MTIITRETAEKVLECVDAGLVKGVGRPILGEMCVEAAVCYALGLPHGDNPKCVAMSLRSLKIRLNDSNWLSPKDRAKGLRRLSLIQLGSLGHLDDNEFIKQVAKMTIKTVLPPLLTELSIKTKSQVEKEDLVFAATECKEKGDRKSAILAKKAAAGADTYAAGVGVHVDSVAAYARAYAAAAAAGAGAFGACDAYAFIDNDAASAAYAAYDAVGAAAYVCAYDIGSDATATASADANSILNEFAENVVQILIKLKVPGAQWLYLTE